MILLDTHTVVWLYLHPERLSARARASIAAEPDGGLLMASITMWEIAQLAARGRLALQGTTTDWITRMVARTGVRVLDITPAIADLAYQVARDFTGCPADRIIVATARAHGAPLVTKDRRMARLPILQTIW